MIVVRPADQRGRFDHGWLQTAHTFSFGGYRDANHMGFRSLRVMNEDWVQPGQGFGTHPHHDMEIVTYVLEGALEHRDSMGHGEVLRPGEFQRMTAGTGITHSEFNPSADEPVHLYQIWLVPERKGLEPSYEQKAFPLAQRRNRLQLVASPDGADGALSIRQNAKIYLSQLDEGGVVSHELAPGRSAWLQTLRGAVRLGDLQLAAGDGAAISDEQRISIVASEESELLLFDLN